jgi:hypothetical protein
MLQADPYWLSTPVMVQFLSSGWVASCILATTTTAQTKANGPKYKTNGSVSSNMGCVGIWPNRSAVSGRSSAARARGALLCPDIVSPATGMRFRSMTDWNAQPSVMDAARTPRRDGTAD